MQPSQTKYFVRYIECRLHCKRDLNAQTFLRLLNSEWIISLANQQTLHTEMGNLDVYLKMQSPHFKSTFKNRLLAKH